VAAGIALLLVLPHPLLLIRQVRPLAILRGVAASENPAYPRKWTAVAFAVACIALGAIAARTVTSWVSAGFLVAALAVSLGLAVLLAAAAVHLLDRCGRGIRHPAVRQGLRNLARPSLGTHTLIASMALGLTILITTFAAQRVVAEAVVDSLPFDDANLFVAGFEAQHRDEIRTFLAAQAGVAAPISLVTQTRLRLARVNGTPVEQLQRLKRPDAAPETWRDIGCLPDSQSQAGGSLPPRVTVADDVATLLGATTGSLLEFEARGRTISATVAAVRRMSRAEKLWYTFTLDCAALDPQPALFHLAAVRIDPAHLQSARQAVATRFPMVAVLTAQDVAAAIVQVSRDALALTRIVASYAMLASLAVLAAAVAASRRARLHELAILAALGASRNTLLRIYTVELAAIGITAALIAGVLSLGFLSVVLSAILQRAEFVFPWQAIGAAVLASMLLTVAAGWLPLYRSLRRRPMESLRQD
jgi:putative ABC transport system permease protein